MNLDRLGLFLRIVETGSVTAASRRVHLTQPAVSRSLKLLEEDLGVDLFERRGRGLVLTAAGRALVPKARDLLADCERVAREIGRAARRQYFDVRLGTVDSVVSYLFPRVIGPLRSAFPELAIKLFTTRTGELLRRLEANELDLAIVAWSGTPPGQRVHEVAPYRLQFYGRSDRFAELGGVTTDAELSAFPIVEIEALPGQPSLLSADAGSFAVANSLASVKALVLGGFGVGALLDFMLTEEERSVLVEAAVPHDPDCSLYVIAAPAWADGQAIAIEDVLVAALRAAL